MVLAIHQLSRTHWAHQWKLTLDDAGSCRSSNDRGTCQPGCQSDLLLHHLAACPMQVTDSPQGCHPPTHGSHTPLGPPITILQWLVHAVAHPHHIYKDKPCTKQITTRNRAHHIHCQHLIPSMRHRHTSKHMGHIPISPPISDACHMVETASREWWMNPSPRKVEDRRGQLPSSLQG